VLFVGRLEERKGIDVLLQVLLRVLPRYPQVYVDLVGNDQLPGPGGIPYRTAFDNDVSVRPFSNRIRFHGELSEEKLRGLYRACDIFVAPSRFESFGLIFLEAMMFAKPVIGCKAGGMVEIVQEGATGLLAEPGNTASLERCLMQMIEDAPLRQRMGLCGRQRYELLFTPERMANEVIEFLSSVADMNGTIAHNNTVSKNTDLDVLA
jgi:glycogen(starch) synthase